jgi:glyoxylase-like metal-dependent hydrolase (beta-lactamase superfamily II)
MTANIDRNNASMEKIEIRENLYQYYFDVEGDDSPNSIFTCINQKHGKALILDTAYPEYAEKVKADLADAGLETETVIISHYHPDHTAGAVVFNGCRIYASRLYEDNHFNCQRWKPEYTYVKPTHLLNSGDRLSFGSFEISFVHAPGHSKCLMMSHINNDVLHVSDLMMFNSDHKPTLPYVSMGGSFKQHIASLERLKTMDYKTLLINHGYPMDDKAAIEEDIDRRIYYLQRVVSSNGTLPVAACLKTDISDYANPEFHDSNIVQLTLEAYG